jgi:hypothetical protein
MIDAWIDESKKLEKVINLFICLFFTEDIQLCSFQTKKGEW